MNEWSFRTSVALSCLVSIFFALMLGLASAFAISSTLGPHLAVGVGALVATTLIASIIIVAFLFRPRAILSPTARVCLYGLGVLSSAFGLIVANQLWDICVSVLDIVESQLGQQVPRDRNSGDAPYVFITLCASVLTICIVAALVDRRPLTPQVDSEEHCSKPCRSRRRLWLELTMPVVVAVMFWLLLYIRRPLAFEPRVAEGAAVGPLMDGLGRAVMAVIVAETVVASYFCAAACLVWLRRRQSIREEYASYAAMAAVLTCVAGLTSSLPLHPVSQTPWGTTYAFLQIGTGNHADWVHQVFSARVLALLAMGGVCVLLRHLFVRWNGMVSVSQYRERQRQDHPRFYREGLRAWRQLLSGGTLPMPYERPEVTFATPDIAALSDVLEAWRDRARELVRLKSSSYALGEEARWHDLKHCWVGQNLDTGKRMLLFVVHENDDDRIPDQLRYIDEVAEQSATPVGDIIFATITRIGTPPLTHWNGVVVQWLSESELLDDLVDFGDYFHAIKRRATIERLPDSELTILDVYCESMVRFEGNGPPDGVESCLNQWNGEASRRQLALLGDYGQGKSTAALMWVYHQIQSLSPMTRLPLLIELRGLSPRNLTPEELLGAWGQRYNINPRALLRLIIAGRVTLVFEGFDEMDLVGDADMRLRHFRALWSFAFERAKILFTGRPNLFFSTPELEQALRTRGRRGSNAYCEMVTLVPFTVEQVGEALRSRASVVRDQIVEQAKASERFLDLVSRPSLLHVVATIWVEQKLFERNPIELTSAYVMDQFVRASYRRQGLKLATSETYELELTLEELAYFMSGIATYMAANGLENHIAAPRLRDAFELLLEVMPESVSTNPRDGSQAASPLKERLGQDEGRREGALAAVHTAGLLVSDPAAAGKFSFAHKSFMEFLVADVLAAYKLDLTDLNAAAICNVTGIMLDTLLRMPVALTFFAELVARNAKHGLQPDADTPHGQLHLARTLFDTLVSQHSKIFHKAAVAGAVSLATIMRDRRAFGTREFMSIMIPAAILTVLPTREFWMRVACWRLVCRHVGLPETVMHRVIGSHRLPWAQGKPFRLIRWHEANIVARLTRSRRARLYNGFDELNARYLYRHVLRLTLDYVDSRYQSGLIGAHIVELDQFVSQSMSDEAVRLDMEWRASKARLLPEAISPPAVNNESNPVD